MKIAYRLWVLITGVTLVLLIVIWVFLVFLLPERYMAQFIADVDAHVDTVLQLWENGRDISALENYIERYDLHMEIRTADNAAVITVGWPLEADILTYTDVENVVDGLYLTKKYVRPGVGETLAVACPVYLTGAETTLLLVCAPIAPVEDLQNLLSAQMVLITAFALVVTLFLGFWSARMFVRPIQLIQQKAVKMAGGDFTAAIGSRDKSELGDLARTIDDMAEQLSQMETMRQSFIATVSHQYKTPLSIIQGYTELIQDSLPGDLARELDGSFAVIDDEIRRLDRMSRDMLKLSELQSGVKPPELRPLPLLGFCQDICAKLAILAPDLKFSLEIPESLTVQADPPELEHVIQNILQNAIVHAEATELRVWAAEEGDQVRVRLSDDGKGLTEEQKKQIFTRFYKGNNKDRSGSGLGMAIAAAVLEAHGCGYGVESEPGKGTAIWFVLDKYSRLT